jgi:hypothetical protein
VLQIGPGLLEPNTEDGGGADGGGVFLHGIVAAGLVHWLFFFFFFFTLLRALGFFNFHGLSQGLVVSFLDLTHLPKTLNNLYIQIDKAGRERERERGGM